MGKGFENYVPVKERTAAFRTDHPKGRILTDVNVSFEKEAAIIKASIVNEEGITLGTGHSTCTDIGEEKGLEKAESVAVGRALDFAGYAADSSVGNQEEAEEEVSAPAPRAAVVGRKVAPAAPAASPARIATAKPTAAPAPAATTSRINELRSQFGKTKTAASVTEEVAEESASETDENYDFAQTEAEVEATPAPTKTSRLGGLRR